MCQLQSGPRQDSNSTGAPHKRLVFIERRLNFLMSVFGLLDDFAGCSIQMLLLILET